MGQTNSEIEEDIKDLNQYRSSGLITYLIITAKVQRDLLESLKQYAQNKYSKYHDVWKCSNSKHILRL